LKKQVQSSQRSESWTVLRLIRWTTKYLTEKGVKKARLDAEVLLADLLGLTRVDLYLNYDRPLIPSELAAFKERVRRRAVFEPVAYITGHKEFYSLDLKVTPEVLIPRPETEFLVEEALKIAQKRLTETEDSEMEPFRVVDLGTGSGAIAITLACHLQQAVIWALDISKSALNVARSNAEQHDLNARINFMQGDLLDPLKDQIDCFDLIAANLPYVPWSAFDGMDPDVKDFEPRLALDGGEDGLDLIKKAIAQAAPLLKSKGALLLEIWPTQVSRIREAGEAFGYGQVNVCKDLAGHYRLAILMKNNPGG